MTAAYMKYHTGVFAKQHAVHLAADVALTSVSQLGVSVGLLSEQK